MMKVFFLPNCVHCIELKKFLDKQKCEYKSIDLSKDKIACEYLTKLGISGLPYIEGNGWSMIGFDKHALIKKLNIERDLVIKRLRDLGFM